MSPWLLLPVVRIGLGLRLLLQPDLAAHDLGSRPGGHHPVLRLLGTRQLLQGALDLRLRSCRAGTVNVATNAAHALSCLVLASVDRRRRTPALRDASLAIVLATASWAQRSADRAVLTTRLHPSPAYPFTLDVQVEYQLTDDGLITTNTATNVGNGTCPYGNGQHPYLSPGSGLIDACTLPFSADTRITTDSDRQLPTGSEAVSGTPYDFQRPRAIEDLTIDFAFTGLARDAEGRAWVRLTGGPRDGLAGQLGALAARRQTVVAGLGRWLLPVSLRPRG